MGLDMYLYREEYISDWESSNNNFQRVDELVITVTRTFENATEDTRTFVVRKPTQGLWLKVPVMYWRKANAIHKWFVDYSGREDDCTDIYLSGSKLIELRDLCQQVLADHKKAPELLPTQAGFFFGPTEYDEYYFEDLADTVEALKNIKEEDEFIYRASW